MDLLSHPAWSGIAAIGTLLGVAAYIWVERDRFLDASLISISRGKDEEGKLVSARPVSRSLQRILGKGAFDFFLPAIWGVMFSICLVCSVYIDRLLSVNMEFTRLVALMPWGLAAFLALGVAMTVWEGKVRELVNMCVELIWGAMAVPAAMVATTLACHRLPRVKEAVDSFIPYLHMW